MKSSMIQPVKKDQRGMVAIIVTMVILIVLSLVVIGFAQLARREQRQSLDRQLSTQAYYAAESGINLVRDKILEGTYDSDKTSCGTDAAFNTAFGANATQLANESNSTIPCILVDQRLESLEFSSVGPESTVVPLTSETGNFSEISFYWQAKEGNASDFTCGTYPQLPVSSAWACDTGILRVDLIPLPSSGPIQRNNLVNETFTSFLYPGTTGGTVAYSAGAGAANQGIITQANCNTGQTPRFCRATINGLNRQRYYARLTSLYKQNQVTINGRAGVSGDAATFVGAQAKIDVTGKAADVTRRVQVHIPSSESSQVYDFPSFALISAESICKRLTVAPGQPAANDATSIPSCQIN